jgi:hypothetical protein
MEDFNLQEVLTMTNPASSSFFNRVFSNDAAKRGIAGAIAGMLVAIVTEVVWGCGDEKLMRHDHATLE